MALAPPEPPLPAPPTRVRWLIFGLACAASWLLYLHRYAWGIVKPAFKKENPDVTDVELGWLDSAFLATYAIGQIPGGLAGDRFGPRATLSLFTLVWSLAVGGVGWTVNFWRLIVARASFGLAQAGAYPVINKMTHTWFPLPIRTSMQGVVTAMGRVGAACTPVIIATFLMGLLGLSWQTALLVLTVPGVVLAGVLWLAASQPSARASLDQCRRTETARRWPAFSCNGEGGFCRCRCGGSDSFGAAFPSTAAKASASATDEGLIVQPGNAVRLYFRQHISGSVLCLLAAAVPDGRPRLR